LTQAANAALLVIPMMETPTAIANAAAIAAVPGIDALLIGTNDLAAEMGIPGDFGHEKIAGAYETVIAACRKHNKWPGMAGVYVEELMQRYIGMGMRLVLSGSDGAFLMAGASRRAALVRQWGGGRHG
jgi:2-keto-3-deoxy-L-rhamnonate aldolase RhmA